MPTHPSPPPYTGVGHREAGWQLHRGRGKVPGDIDTGHADVDVPRGSYAGWVAVGKADEALDGEGAIAPH